MKRIIIFILTMLIDILPLSGQKNSYSVSLPLFNTNNIAPVPWTEHPMPDFYAGLYYSSNFSLFTGFNAKDFYGNNIPLVEGSDYFSFNIGISSLFRLSSTTRNSTSEPDHYLLFQLGYQRNKANFSGSGNVAIRDQNIITAQPADFLWNFNVESFDLGLLYVYDIWSWKYNSEDPLKNGRKVNYGCIIAGLKTRYLFLLTQSNKATSPKGNIEINTIANKEIQVLEAQNNVARFLNLSDIPNYFTMSAVAGIGYDVELQDFFIPFITIEYTLFPIENNMHIFSIHAGFNLTIPIAQ